MLVRYVGPPDQYDGDVAAALSEQRGSVTVELPDERAQAQEGDVVLGTEPSAPASGMLEPGRDYDLPQELAQARLEGTPWWEVSAQDFSKLSATRLKALAKERAIPGYTKMSQDELVAALRASSGPPNPDSGGQS